MTGCEFTASSMYYVDLFRAAITLQLNDNYTTITDQLELLCAKGTSDEQRKHALSKIATAASSFSELRSAWNELKDLEESGQMYHIYETTKYSDAENLRDGTTMDHLNGYVLIGIDGFRPDDRSYYFGGLAHELHHAYQFDIGELSIDKKGAEYSLYDIHDEYAAYKRGAQFGQPYKSRIEINKTYYNLPLERRSVSNITLDTNESYQDFANKNRIAFRYTYKHNGTTYKGF